MKALKAIDYFCGNLMIKLFNLSIMAFVIVPFALVAYIIIAMLYLEIIR